MSSISMFAAALSAIALAVSTNPENRECYVSGPLVAFTGTPPVIVNTSVVRSLGHVCKGCEIQWSVMVTWPAQGEATVLHNGTRTRFPVTRGATSGHGQTHLLACAGNSSFEASWAPAGVGGGGIVYEYGCTVCPAKAKEH